jgi:hypothetical protein
VTGTVGYKVDQALRLVQSLQDGLNYFQIGALVVTAYIVNLAYTTLVNDQVDGSAVVIYMQPVAYVLTLAVYGQLFIRQSAADHQRDQLLGEVIRAVVVRATGYGHRQSISSVVSQNEQIGAGLTGRIRTGSVQRGSLGKEQVRTIQRQIAIYLVSRYLMVSLYTVGAGCVQQHSGTQYVGAYKDTGIGDGTVYVRLGSKVYYHVKLLLCKQIHDELTVCDIALYKLVVGLVLHGLQSLQIASIGQQIQVHDLILGILVYHVMYKVAADKTGATGY